MDIQGTADGRIHRTNVLMCGSAWTCPDCVQHIGAARADEVRRFLNQVLNDTTDRHRVIMTTLTIPHDDGQTAGEVFDQLRRCLRAMDSDGTTRRINRERGYVGRIRSIEVTRGKRGWHFHVHQLDVFDMSKATISDGELSDDSADSDRMWAFTLQGAYFRPWQRIVAAVTGKPASRTHAVTCVPVWSDTDYTVKLPEQAAERKEKHGSKPRWGAEGEMTKSYMKEARKASRTPWEILDDVTDGSDNDEAANLFRDYARGTYNRAQIEWSPALRKLYRFEIKTDEQIKSEPPVLVILDEANDDLDGDMAGARVDRVLLSREVQNQAFKYANGWLDSAEHGMLSGFFVDLPDALRSLGFHLDKECDMGMIPRHMCPRTGQTIPAKIRPRTFRATFPIMTPIDEEIEEIDLEGY